MCAITHIKMPFPMSNRSFANLYYEKKNQDGSYEYINSSRDNQEVVDQCADIIKRNVVANTIFDYRKVTPMPDGSCEWEAALCVDISGSIPAALQRAGAEQMLAGVENVIYLIRHGKAPSKK